METSQWSKIRCHSDYFNPLHREGGDRTAVYGRDVRNRFQSTPPRGWRPDRPTRNSFLTVNFNPLHREGGDRVYSAISDACFYFNPLHREGGDSVPGFYTSLPQYFNPLHREGGDSAPPNNPCSSTAISIHSTARVETMTFPPSYCLRKQFQSTPPRGWRLLLRPFVHHCISYFNPLHREGGDSNTTQ